MPVLSKKFQVRGAQEKAAIAHRLKLRKERRALTITIKYTENLKWSLRRSESSHTLFSTQGIMNYRPHNPEGFAYLLLEQKSEKTKNLQSSRVEGKSDLASNANDMTAEIQIILLIWCTHTICHMHETN